MTTQEKSLSEALILIICIMKEERQQRRMGNDSLLPVCVMWPWQRDAQGNGGSRAIFSTSKTIFKKTRILKSVLLRAFIFYMLSNLPIFLLFKNQVLFYFAKLRVQNYKSILKSLTWKDFLEALLILSVAYGMKKFIINSRITL